MLHNARTTGCLTCGNDHGRFESVEHIIPAALGNTESSGLVERDLTVPKGETCMKCNGQRPTAVARRPRTRRMAADLGLPLAWPHPQASRRTRRRRCGHRLAPGPGRVRPPQLLAARRRRHKSGVTPQRRSAGALQNRAGDTLAAGPQRRSQRSLGPDRERRDRRRSAQRARDGPRPARIALRR